MREEKRERITTTYDTIYIAEDGTEFRSADECEEYEKTAECVICGAVAKLDRGRLEDVGDVYWHLFGVEEALHAIEIRNADDLQAFNMFLTYKKASQALSAHETQFPLGGEVIGKTVYYGEWWDDVYYYGDRESFVNYLYRHVDKLFASIDEEYKKRMGANAREEK